MAGGLLARYCVATGQDERHVRERLAWRRQLEGLALRLAVAADEGPPAPARPAAAAPAPPAGPPEEGLLLALRLALRHRRGQLHALLAEALAPELESLARGIGRLGGAR